MFSTPGWGSNLPARVDIFLYDIMMAEPKSGNRLDLGLNNVETEVRGELGRSAIIEDSLASECHWSVLRILSGFMVNVETGEIAMPREKVESGIWPGNDVGRGACATELRRVLHPLAQGKPHLAGLGVACRRISWILGHGCGVSTRG